MTIELTTAVETAPLEVLDLQVLPRPAPGKSLLSLRFLCRNDHYANHLSIPTLSWFDASQLQRFSQEVVATDYPHSCRVDLMEAGLRLTGTVRRLAERWATSRTIVIEPLPTSVNQFTPFTLQVSHRDASTYAGKLYNQLWEVFTRG
jgi:hypothetical protein